MSNITDMAQAWHDDGDDDSHAIDKVTGEILEATIEKYGLEPTEVQEARLEMILREIVEESIDWKKIADDDDNARGWEDARRSALYK